MPVIGFGQNLDDSLVSFVKTRSKMTGDYYAIYSETNGGNLPFDIKAVSKSFGGLHVFREAFVVEFSDSTTVSWRFIQIMSTDSNSDSFPSIMQSKPLIIKNLNYNYQILKTRMELLNNSRMIHPISRFVSSKGDTTYRENHRFHDSDYEIRLFTSPRISPVYYEFSESWITIGNENIPDYEFLNLNYSYNLKTEQFKFFDWMRTYTSQIASNYVFE
jgi:hypothetical protein